MRRIGTFDAVSPSAPSANAEGLGVPGPAGVGWACQISSIEFGVLGGRFVMRAFGRLNSMRDRHCVRRQVECEPMLGSPIASGSGDWALDPAPDRTSAR
jgi:hypothetical protein